MQFVTTCTFCLMTYLENEPADRYQHQKYYRKCVESYLEIRKTGKTSWIRPEVENEGVYRALNELNPNLDGFTFLGISHEDKLGICQDLNPLPIGIGCGDGHDRSGMWASVSGTKYSFNANWRAGMVTFTTT